ncbi:MAG: PAS domain-containing sensor histidine kinase [Bacteroidales bacterium]
MKRLKKIPGEMQELKDDVITSEFDKFYCGAIEHAGAVPYQFFFAEKSGEGRYIGPGSGISDLLEIQMKEFPEGLFDHLIERVIPLSAGATSDLRECRRRIRDGEVKSCRTELLVRTKEGGRKWLLDSLVPVIDDVTGSVKRAFGILYDITSSKAACERIKVKEEELNSLKRALINNIAHEIRTPLNAIVGFAALLNEYVDNPERRKECLDIITRNSDHLAAIIDGITEISKIDSKMTKIRKESINPDEVLLKIYAEFQQEASSKGLDLVRIPDGNKLKPVVSTDCFKLLEILRNLVGNAIKFTFEGKVEFGYNIEKANIKFYVHDTGIGIPFEQQSRIFSRFFQSDFSSTRRFDGIGLGLSIAKSYVELLGGRLWLNSVPGGGSVFKFTLPYESGDTE